MLQAWCKETLKIPDPCQKMFSKLPSEEITTVKPVQAVWIYLNGSCICASISTVMNNPKSERHSFWEKSSQYFSWDTPVLTSWLYRSFLSCLHPYQSCSQGGDQWSRCPEHLDCRITVQSYANCPIVFSGAYCQESVYSKSSLKIVARFLVTATLR